MPKTYYPTLLHSVLIALTRKIMTTGVQSTVLIGMMTMMTSMLITGIMMEVSTVKDQE